MSEAEKPRGAETASFYLNTAPIATGVVTRLLVNPFGEVDGLVLDSGTLDVHFVSSLPVRRRPVYRAWVDTRPVQIVWAVNSTTPDHDVVDDACD